MEEVMEVLLWPASVVFGVIWWVGFIVFVYGPSRKMPR